jgi:voltage-gated potassium channel
MDPPPLWQTVLNVSQWALWAVFIADFAYRARLSERPWHYIATHPFDVAILILPMLRPFRALRVFAAARLLIERGTHVSYGRVAMSISLAAFFVVLVGALAVLQFERPAVNSDIDNFGDALWWSVVTMATVGYGDFYPVTLGGRLSAVAMMIVGVSLIGAITATFASWFVQRVRGPEDLAEKQLMSEVADLRAEIALLRSELLGQRAVGPAPDAVPPAPDAAAAAPDAPDVAGIAGGDQPAARPS